MAFTSEDRDNIKRLMAGGVSTVRMSDGRTVTNRSYDELKNILADIEAELNNSGESAVVTSQKRCGTVTRTWLSHESRG